MSRQEHHVVPSPNGGWDIERNNAQRISGHFDTKSEAVTAARTMSKNAGTELIVHGRNGKIQNPDSHGNDPCPPKDRR